MNRYETVIILKPDLKPEEYKRIKHKYITMLRSFSKDEIKVEDTGKKKLAYEIKGSYSEGYYMMFTFSTSIKGGSDDIAQLEREYRVDDDVLKFMTIKLDDTVDDEYGEVYDESKEIIDDSEQQRHAGQATALDVLLGLKPASELKSEQPDLDAKSKRALLLTLRATLDTTPFNEASIKKCRSIVDTLLTLN